CGRATASYRAAMVGRRVGCGGRARHGVPDELGTASSGGPGMAASVDLVGYCRLHHRPRDGGDRRATHSIGTGAVPWFVELADRWSASRACCLAPARRARKTYPI